MSMKQISFVSIAGKCQRVEEEWESRERFHLAISWLKKNRIKKKKEKFTSFVHVTESGGEKEREREVVLNKQKEVSFNHEIDF